MSSLILFKNSEGVEKLSPIEYTSEKELQDLLKGHPEIISSTINFSDNVEVIAEEYVLPSGLSIDLLCVDKDGRIYIVETKLYANFDRRQIIAQLLDYAAQLRKQPFEDFKTKIKELNKNGKTLEDFLKDMVDEEQVQAVLENIKENLSEGNFILVAVMDKVDEEMRDLITYLNKYKYMDVFAIELLRYKLKDKGEVFVPSVIPQEISTKQPPSRETTTIDDFIRIYSEAGLKDEAEAIVKAFDNAKKSGKAEIKQQPQYLTLRIPLPNGKSITISFKKDPRRGDHGVWAYDPSLYKKLSDIGNELGLEVKMSDKPSAKIIRFNGADGVKQVSKVIHELVSKLLELTTSLEEQKET